MGSILFTKNTPYDLRDWQQRQDIIEVYGGHNCIMALCSDGTVLRKCIAEKQVVNTFNQMRYIQAGSFTSEDAELAGWKNVRQISLSSQYPGLALGITAEGDCIALLPTAHICETDLQSIIQTISGWHNIAEVSALHDLFALTREGNVLQWCFPTRRGGFASQTIERRRYSRCDSWKDIAHIRGGNLAICGLTRHGSAVLSYPWDSQISEDRCFKDVIDAYPAGSEGDLPLIVQNNHTLISVLSNNCTIICHEVERLIGGLYSTFALTTDERLLPALRMPNVDEVRTWRGITSATVGFKDWQIVDSFVLAVTREHIQVDDFPKEAAVVDDSEIGTIFHKG